MSNLNTFLNTTKDPNYPRPYIYVFPLGGLSSGQDYPNLSVPVQRDYPFTLCRLSGLTTAVPIAFGSSTLQLYDGTRSRRFSEPFPVAGDYPFIPGIAYPADSQIRFDLFLGTAPATTDQLIFQGVKHVWGSSYGYQTPYPFYEKPQTYVTRLTIADVIGTSPRVVAVPLLSRDFELLKIVMSIRTADFAFDVVPQNKVALELFDSMGFPVQSAPVNDTFLNYNDTTYSNGWPNPPMIWPANGEIKLNLHSLMSAPQLPAVLNLEFHGINRFPYADGDQIVRMRNVSA